MILLLRTGAIFVGVLACLTGATLVCTTELTGTSSAQAIHPPADLQIFGNRLVLQGQVEKSSSGVQDQKPGSSGSRSGVRRERLAQLYNVESLSTLLNEKEIYHELAFDYPVLPHEPPVVEKVRAYFGHDPLGLLLVDPVVEILGKNFDSTTRIRLNGEVSPPLVTEPNRIVAKLEGLGNVRFEVATEAGLAGAAREMLLLRISAGRKPPPVLENWTTEEIELRIEGTPESLPILVTSGTSAVSFLDGSRRMVVTSSGGAPNLARVAIRAREIGAYHLTAQLADSQGSAVAGEN